MTRIAIAAAFAAALAAPAWAADSIHIPTAGKSPEQIKAEVSAAAHKLCLREVETATFPIQEMAACMKQTVAATFAQAQDPALKLAVR
jgi:hypothetical protein